MRQILDLHIHSKYSRACSKELTLKNIDKACRIKGVDIISTADFTHPAWFSSIKQDLEEIANSGLYKIKGSDSKIKFILGTELSLIYKDKDKARRIHLVVHAPKIEAVQELNDFLGKYYNIKSDGRPILGIKSKELIKILLKIHPEFLIYPAHIWTPWFSVFGSKSGFNSLEECFDEETDKIFAYETGLSSDPEMNWRLSKLDGLTLLSNSDAHSLNNIAREANVFDLEEITYQEIYQAIKKKDLNKIKETIEFYPEEGMYHYDGHRSCGICFSPQESLKNKNICPICHKPLVIGVLNRVEELADRTIGFKPDNSYGFKKVVELDKIIAENMNVKSRNSKKVVAEYEKIINQLGSELDVLLEVDLKKIEQVAGKELALGIEKMRQGKLMVKPGFDGQYGEVKIFFNKKEIRQDFLFI
jgi:uncharacterized protein (TIGR00375 family)